MTVVENTVQRGFRAAWFLALGAALVEGFQAFFALYCTSFFSVEKTQFTIQVIAAILFLALGFYSFYLALRGNNSTLSSKIQLPQFWKGVVISLLNMLAIPYWLVNSAYLDTHGLLHHQLDWTICFCIGVAAGTFLLLLLYAQLAKQILSNLTEVNKWTNIFLGSLLIFLASVQLWQLMPQW